MAIVVELDVFSGRPNPTWVLDRPLEEEFFSRLGSLPLARRPAAPAPGLG